MAPADRGKKIELSLFILFIVLFLCEGNNEYQGFRTQLLFIIVLLVISLCLRLYHLSFQSFWLDEIHTAKEADMGLRDLISFLYCCDGHPPLFFVAEKTIVSIFGNSEFFARLPCALVGTISIWAVYLLGKELFDRQTGRFAALFACFNSFHIQYSQEARPYIFMFCFVVFSFLFLVRFIKKPRLRFGVAYAVFILLALYSHYFSILIAGSQLIIAFIACLYEKDERKRFLTNFLISGSIILALFSFQVKHILSLSGISSFWIEKPKDSFAMDIVFQFFGHSNLLFPLIVLLCISGLLYLFTNSLDKPVHFKTDPACLAFVVLFCWTLIVLMIPYLRSLLDVPMIVPRYFISILPVFILLLSIGLKIIGALTIRLFVAGAFCLLSVIDIFFVQDYYNTVQKTQFRELASFITKYNSHMLNAPLTSWHQQYYLYKSGFKGEVSGQEVHEFSDRVIGDSNTVSGFWLADAHGAYPPSSELLDRLNRQYIRVASAHFYDAWAMLYLNKKDSGLSYSFIDEQSFDPSTTVFEQDEKVIPVWDNTPVSRPVSLTKGKYRVEVLSSGQPADSVYPHLNFKFDGAPIGSFFTGKSMKYNVLNLVVPADRTGDFQVCMDNDFASKKKGEDRNAFIKTILIIRE